MDDNALRTLALVLSGGQVAPPGPGRPFAFLNARPIPSAATQWRAALRCEQGFRPHFLDLAAEGYDAVPVLTGEKNGHAGAIVLAGRARRANEVAIARAWSLVAEGGPLVVAGSKRDGIQSLRKWVAGFVPLDDSVSKHHAVVFVATRRGADPFPPDRANPPAPVSPAMFSAAGTDAGSQFLAGYIDGRISGLVADFGAGSGFLSRVLLERCDGLAGIDAYEADYVSLEVARAGLQLLAGAVPLRFFWRDLLREAPERRYHWIVMNPPFHEGRAARPEIGAGFIAAAAGALAPGGRLLMVANRNLPYEAALKTRFRRFDKLGENAIYKVCEALR